MTNYGEFGYMYGYWPTGSGESYIFGAGIWVGAIRDGDPLVSCGYSTISAGCDWMPGPPEHNYDHSVDLSSHPEDRFYLSTRAVDRKEWPLRDSLGFPIVLSGQDGWCEYNDLWEPQHGGEPGTYPLGLRMRQRSFCWSFPTLLEDMLFILYEMENVSGDTIKEMYVGIGADMDVGWADDDLVDFDIDLGIGYTYCLQQQPGWSSEPPYYAGVAAVQAPRASDTVYVRDGPWNPDYPYAIRDTVLPDSQLVLTSLARWSGWFSMDDERRYLTLAGYNMYSGEYNPWPDEDRVPSDKRMILGCGPFELQPGEVDTFLIAVIFSNSSTGGLDHLLRQAAIAKSVARTVAHQPLVRIVSPNGGEELSGAYGIGWETLDERVDTVDLYLTPDSGKSWVALATHLENTGSYLWDTEITPDGFYFLNLYGRNHVLLTWDLSDAEFTVNNLANGAPQARLLTPNRGDTLSGTVEIHWWARDPEDDDISINLYYSNDDGHSFLPIAVGLPNLGTHLCNTQFFPNGTECLIKVEAADDSLTSFDCSDSSFALFNSHKSAGEAEHVAGGCNTVTLTPEIIRESERTGQAYEIRFGPHRFDSLTNKAIYSYDVYGVASGITVLESQEFSVDLDGTPANHYSPLFDGVSLRIETLVDSTTFNPCRVSPGMGEYADDLQIEGWFVPGSPERQFTTPECKIWAFRGKGMIRMEWTEVRDTLSVAVYDVVNNTEIPPDTTIGIGWCFSGRLPLLRPKLFLTEENRAIWFYVSGVRYWFNSGAGMTQEGFSSIDSGDVWLLYNQGDRPPYVGDVFTFRSFDVPLYVRQTEILLSPSFPNPFSGSTAIAYYLPCQMDVSLIIYDSAGRRVRELIRGVRRYGVHRLRWNGTDDSGRRVSQGVYFCRLSVHPDPGIHRDSETSEITSTKKIVVLN